MDRLAPDTTLALMQTSHADVGKAASKVQNAKSSIDIKKAEEAAQEFEAVFIAEMMKPMFEGITSDGPFGGGKGEEIFRGMMLEEYGKLLSQTGGIGIASEVKEAMIRMQQEANGEDHLGLQTGLETETNTETNTTETALTNGDSNATSHQ